MSDRDFQELIEGIEKFVCDEIRKMSDKVETATSKLDKKIDSLKDRFDSVDRRLDAVEEDVRAVEGSAKEMLTSVIDGARAALTSTPPSASITVPEQESSTPIRPRKSVQADDLLKEFISPTNSADKLDQMQRAFVRYYCNLHPSDKINDVFSNRCIREGCRIGVWQTGFVPDGVSDFGSYLKESIRNQRKHDSRLSFKRNQRKRLASYINRSENEMYMVQEDDDMSTFQPETEEPALSAPMNSEMVEVNKE